MIDGIWTLYSCGSFVCYLSTLAHYKVVVLAQLSLIEGLVSMPVS